MCFVMRMCVVRRTRSVCKSPARGVQGVQVGCCIVQLQVAHSVPIFLSVAVAHGHEEVAADVMWSVCVVPGKTSFTNEDHALQALKKMNDGHEDKGVGPEEKAELVEAKEDNDKVVEATEDKQKETVPDAKAKGGGDEPDADAIAEWIGASDPSHGKGRHPRPMRKWCVLTKREGTKKVNEPMEEGEQGAEPKPMQDVNNKSATASDTSVAVVEEGKSDGAPKTYTPNKEGLDATQKLWSLPHPQWLADTLVHKLGQARGWENMERHGTHYRRLLIGAVKAFPSSRKEIAISARTPKTKPSVRCI